MKESSVWFRIFARNLEPDDLGRVSPTNRKILFHSSHGIPRISNRNTWSYGKRPFSFEKVSFIAPGVPFTSTAIALLIIVLSRFYTDLNDTFQSSIKLIPRLALELTQPSHNGTAFTCENHYHIFLRLNTRVEIFFHFPFSLWFQRNLAKIKQRE